ncbi:protein FIZZY-RELATED 3 isoform X2 [Beta vulgaris subsp. vulgaris]|uniref:protein FIZZY-RELATED 3 isoform X2 n=1 Tax=Beta vulgaris subsp. vulgaris TaxID=3555 RepID=UPI002036DDF2|nr:protein FIZZY-RELATED 3 isoform X2 [Beta vulgaris subsp. vulgaris]
MARFCKIRLRSKLRLMTFGTIDEKIYRMQVCGLKWSQDDRELTSGGNQLSVWNQQCEQPILKLTEHTTAMKAIAWSPHQSGLLTCGGGTADRSTLFWNTTNGNQINSINTGSQELQATQRLNWQRVGRRP